MKRIVINQKRKMEDPLVFELNTNNSHEPLSCIPERMKSGLITAKAQIQMKRKIYGSLFFTFSSSYSNGFVTA